VRRPRSDAVHTGHLDAGNILVLQRLAGNGAVTMLLQGADRAGDVARPVVQRASGPAAGRSAAEWAPGEVKPIQRELRRLGLYDKCTDGVLGCNTRASLDDAFGGHEWERLGADGLLTNLATTDGPRAG
jgi:hypothetical protein